MSTPPEEVDMTENVETANNWAELERDILAAPSSSETESPNTGKKRQRRQRTLRALGTTKVTEGALPTFEERRDSDAEWGIGASEDIDELRQSVDGLQHEEEDEEEEEEEEEVNNESESTFDEPRASNASSSDAIDRPPSSPATLIPISRKPKKSQEVIVEEEGADSPSGKTKKKKTSKRSSSVARKRKAADPDASPISGSPPPGAVPLPPPLALEESTVSQSPPPPPFPARLSTAPRIPLPPIPRSNSAILTRPPSMISESDSVNDDSEGDSPPPVLHTPASSDSNLRFPSTRKSSSLATDGFTTLRESSELSDSSERRKERGLKRRQSTKTSIKKKAITKSTPEKTRPKMSDGTIRIVKSMYENKNAIDPRIFVMEAKERPDNVIYVHEDEEATEDYNLDYPAIKAATLEKLILGLTPEAYADPDFCFAFLLNYPSFTTADTVIELLTVRWNIPTPQKPSKTGFTVDLDTFVKKKLTPVRLRIFNIIKLWLEEHKQSIDTETRSLIEKFVKDVVAKDMPGPANTLLRLVKGETAGTQAEHMFDEKPPKPYLPMNVKTKLTILDIHPEELARQITLIDSGYYRKIKPSEFLNSGWTKSDKDVRAPGILAMINSFNVLSKWVSTQILTQTDLKQRAITLNRIICIAQKCYELNNFNGVMEIVASLQNSAIHRLYNTWELLPQKSWEMFENLSLLMNSNAGEGNFHLYRTALKKVVPPIVPYLGVYLTDLIFLNDGNSNFIDEQKRMINFHKMAKIARVVRTITIHQQTPYCLTPVEFIQDFITQGHLMSEDEQYAESCKLEKKIPKTQRAQTTTSKTIKKIKVDFKALNINDA